MIEIQKLIYWSFIKTLFLKCITKHAKFYHNQIVIAMHLLIDNYI